MIIIGIDPGTARMGYGVIDGTDSDTFKLIKSDVLETHKDLEPEKRLRLLYKKLSEVSKEYKPDVMVIERLFFNRNVKTAIEVGQARGISMLVAADRKMKVIDYTALQAKKVLTGYGRASKKEMQEAVRSILKLDFVIKSDDANDAVAMALCYLMKDCVNIEGE